MVVGWDWASATHDVTVIDDTGSVVDHWTPPHTEAGLDETVIRLARWGRPQELPVAIELSGGLVVDRLVAAGHPVVPIHASAFHAARPRWGAAGAKSDPGDSYKLADYLRTDGHRLGRLRPPDDVTRELQARVRLREDHVKAKVAASTSSARCWTPTGLAPRRSSPGWPRGSPWPSWRPIRTLRQPPAWARHGWRPSAAATPTAVAAAPPSCSPGSGRSRRRRSGWPQNCSPS